VTYIHYIDDDTIDRMAFQRMIKRFTSYRCRCFSSWKEAMASEESDEVTLYVTDFYLPQEDIFDRVRSSSKPVLVTSGIHQEEAIEQVIQLGAKGFIQKPISASDLAEFVDALQIESN